LSPILGIIDSSKSGNLNPTTTFVALNYGASSGASSPDAVTWTARTMPATANWYSLLYANGKFVTLANGSVNGAYSTNGTTWTAFTPPSAKPYAQTAYGAGIYVAISQSDPPYTATSSDGITWSGGNIGGSGEAYSGVVYGNGYFVMPGTRANNDNRTLYSSNGTSWNSGGLLPYSVGWGRIYYAASGGGFIVTANTSSNYVAQSTSGTGSWTSRTLPSTTTWLGCLAFGNGVWSYLTNADAASSTDGITWTSRTTPAAITFVSMSYSANYGLFVAVAASSSVAYTSSTGTGSWTSRTLPTSGEWYSVSSAG
jgi:hypothetical protein